MRADSIEAEIFSRCVPDVAKFEPFGFVRDKNGYRYETDFLDGQFKAKILISFENNDENDGVASVKNVAFSDWHISARVFELATGEEYLPLRARRQQGAFVYEVREAYKTVLREIRDSCFSVSAFTENRAQHTWIIPVKPDYYDVEQDFKRDGKIWWNQRVSVQVGDTVYMYMSAPIFAIRYQCRVIQADCVSDSRKEMQLQLVRRYDDEKMSRSRLQSLGVKSVRSARHLPESVIAAMED